MPRFEPNMRQNRLAARFWLWLADGTHSALQALSWIKEKWKQQRKAKGEKKGRMEVDGRKREERMGRKGKERDDMTPDFKTWIRPWGQALNCQTFFIRQFIFERSSFDNIGRSLHCSPTLSLVSNYEDYNGKADIRWSIMNGNLKLSPHKATNKLLF